jgi:predicted nucleotidyltransferase
MNKRTDTLTKTEEALLSFLFVYPTTSFRGRELAKSLKKPASGVIGSARKLEKKGIVNVSKDFVLSIKLNRENKNVFALKKIHNLSSLHKSGLTTLLADEFPSAAIVLFGSYSRGEDTEESDIDIAVIGYAERRIAEILPQYEQQLGRHIELHFFKSTREIHKDLRENIINGIVLEGAIRL